MGKEATLEIVDDQAGPWGNIGVGKIIFADHEAVPRSLEELDDFGTMGLALLGAAGGSLQRRRRRYPERQAGRRNRAAD